ncbi:hypothetical protein CBR_g24153 [Chara braunii]|uniref:Mce/MlaD domain-containing protein n=1 Tax=Chara braunii TaxID=69332 RepID=A0A388L5X4_CHABU|nr:hypothetical protein CBR_g24153 [Chara braunii]|eukprot:GBG77706.1 hypothetical protein CBR_g24153 [Chara braunii]
MAAVSQLLASGAPRCEPTAAHLGEVQRKCGGGLRAGCGARVGGGGGGGAGSCTSTVTPSYYRSEFCPPAAMKCALSLVHPSSSALTTRHEILVASSSSSPSPSSSPSSPSPCSSPSSSSSSSSSSPCSTCRSASCRVCQAIGRRRSSAVRRDALCCLPTGGQSLRRHVGNQAGLTSSSDSLLCTHHRGIVGSRRITKWRGRKMEGGSRDRCCSSNLFFPSPTRTLTRISAAAAAAAAAAVSAGSMPRTRVECSQWLTVRCYRLSCSCSSSSVDPSEFLGVSLLASSYQRRRLLLSFLSTRAGRSPSEPPTIVASSSSSGSPLPPPPPTSSSSSPSPPSPPSPSPSSPASSSLASPSPSSSSPSPAPSPLAGMLDDRRLGDPVTGPPPSLWSQILKPLNNFGFGKRSIWEGGVGLFVMAGVFMFGLSLSWIYGVHVRTRNRKYTAVLEFAQACGITVGTPVRIRGVNVGTVMSVRPSLDRIDAVVEIMDQAVVIPRNSLVEVNQSGLISETLIDITPKPPIPTVSAGPLDSACASEGLIVCDRGRMKGEQGVSLDELVGICTKIARQVDQHGVGKMFDTAERVSMAIEDAKPLLGKVESLATDIAPLLKDLKEGELLHSLEELTCVAADAAKDLRKLNSAILTDDNIKLLKESVSTLTRTLKHIESISGDVSSLTGDPATRYNIKQIVQSLSRLVTD